MKLPVLISIVLLLFSGFGFANEPATDPNLDVDDYDYTVAQEETDYPEPSDESSEESGDESSEETQPSSGDEE